MNSMRSIFYSMLTLGIMLSSGAAHAATAATAANGAAAQAAPAPLSPEFAAQLKQLLKAHPEILLDVLRDNSETVLEIMQQGADLRRDQALRRQWGEDAKAPKTVALDNRPSRGPKTAPITLISFSDFTCSYCQQAAVTVETLLRRYPDQIRFVFKQTPPSEVGRVPSQWFLSALKQDQAKAWKFYALMFDRQQQYLADPMVTLRAVAVDAGLDTAKLEADVKAQGKAYDDIIAADLEDAKKLGFHGTPYFLVNNLVIRGSLPLESFIDAVEFAKKVGK